MKDNENKRETNLEFARRLKSALAHSNLTWSQLAEQTGIPKSAMTAYKNGEYMPKQNNIFKMANSLGVDPSWLLCFDGSTEKAPDTNPELDEYIVQLLTSVTDTRLAFVLEFLKLPEAQAQRVMDFLAGLKAAEQA